MGNERFTAFTYQQITVATKNFQHLLGKGGFGNVYKGVLETGETIAVKVLNVHGRQGEKEFLVEALMLQIVSHPNIVNLLGWCVSAKQRLLVYELMQLGSLKDHLYGGTNETLNWSTRILIATDVARGLDYLHSNSKGPIIFRDLKPANVLLDKGYTAKLSDFRLATLGAVGEDYYIAAKVVGSYGYCDPEYSFSGRLSSKADVYSFGVLLIELFTGRRAFEKLQAFNQQDLVSWARPLLRDTQLISRLVDPSLGGNYPLTGLCTIFTLAWNCVQPKAVDRPFIGEAFRILGALESEPYVQSVDPVEQVELLPMRLLERLEVKEHKSHSGRYKSF